MLGVAALVLLILGGVAYWAMTQMDDPPISIGRAPTATPVPTVAPTPTRAPGIGINIPGPQGTPTTVTLPIPVIGDGRIGDGTPGLPNLPIPSLPGQGDGSPGIPTITLPTIAIPGASGTPPPNAKLTADGVREKVKDSLTNCRLLQGQIELSQVTFEAPTWTVRLPLTGASWTVNDDTGEITPDERASERIRNCRL